MLGYNSFQLISLHFTTLHIPSFHCSVLHLTSHSQSQAVGSALWLSCPWQCNKAGLNGDNISHCHTVWQDDCHTVRRLTLTLSSVRQAMRNCRKVGTACQGQKCIFFLFFLLTIIIFRDVRTLSLTKSTQFFFSVSTSVWGPWSYFEALAFL